MATVSPRSSFSHGHNERSTSSTINLDLDFGFEFADLYDRTALTRLDARFLVWLSAENVTLSNRLLAARADPATLDYKAESDLLIELGPYVEAFIGRLFRIQDLVAELARRGTALAPIYEVKRRFVQRIAIKKFKQEEAEQFDPDALNAAMGLAIRGADGELEFAEQVLAWQQDEVANAAAIDAALRYAAWAALSRAGRARHAAGVLFKYPGKIDPLHLVPFETIELDGVRMMRMAPSHWRQREGFALTDPGIDLNHALDQMNYCIWCHAQGKDSCSKGLIDKKTNAFQKTTFGVSLAGCPLEEKISEMHALKAQGSPLGAFGVMIIDNPMVAATGHRICNDCMKACIYQKQEPVDIPQAETRILKDILDLPWGFEIYSLLTRWNPLNVRRPLPRSQTARKVLVVGLGPAGFALSHHLMNDGHAVVGIDGLKIEPLPPDLSGVDQHSARVSFRPSSPVPAHPLPSARTAFTEPLHRMDKALGRKRKIQR